MPNRPRYVLYPIQSEVAETGIKKVTDVPGVVPADTTLDGDDARLFRPRVSSDAEAVRAFLNANCHFFGVDLDTQVPHA